MPDLVDVLIALGALVVVPLGLRLLDAPGLPAVRRLWPVGAVAAAVSLALPTGPVAGALAAGYAVLAVAAAAAGLARLVADRSLAAPGLAACAALGYLAVAGPALVADRLHARPLGYSHEIVKLTAAHFHYAGFAASLLSGLAARALAGPTRTGQWSAASCYAVVFAPAVVGLTFSAGAAVQLAGVLPLATALVVLAVLTLRGLVPGLRPPAARALLAASALAVLVPMALAADWTLGRAAGLPHLTLEQMEATHGVLNAAGYALCGVLAWTLRPTAAPL